VTQNQKKEKEIKNSAIYLLAAFVGTLLPFMALPVFTRILTKEDYGVLALVNVYAMVASGLVSVGMTEAYKRNYFRYQRDLAKTSQLFYSVVVFISLNSLCLAIVTFFFRGNLARFFSGSDKNGDILFLAFCAQAFTGINYYYFNYLRNAELARDYTCYTVAASVLTVAMSLFQVVYLNSGVTGLVLGQLFAGIIIFSVLNFKFGRDLTPSFDRQLLYESIKIGYPLIPRICFGVIRNQFDKYMIGLVASVGGAGIYSLGQRIASVSFTYMTALHNVYNPQVLQKMFSGGEKGGETIGHYLTPFAYVSVFVPFGLSLFAEELIVFMMPVSYYGAIPIVSIIALYYGFLFVGRQSQLLYAKKMHIVSALSIFSIVLNVLLNILFILEWGAVGAAWATLLAGMLHVIIHFIVSQHYYKIQWEYYKVGAIYLLFFISATLLITMNHFMVAYHFRLLVKIISLAVYVLLGNVLGLLTKDNLLLVITMLNRNQTESIGAKR